MKKTIKILASITLASVFLFSASSSFAGEIDILVEKLVDKGILSHGEAQQILTETKEEVRKEIAKGTYSSLPSWIQKMKLKGDLRLRYQWEDKTGSEDRHRARYRFRLGLETKANDKLNVAAGLATGGDDPRSTNQTMADTFSTPDIRLDYAYAAWQAAPWATVLGGKIKSIKSLIFRPSDLLWDSDINPEGISIQLSKGFDNGLDTFLNTGVWVLDESGGDTSDPFMAVIQPGFSYKFNDDVSLTAAVAGYFFDNVQDSTLDHSAGTNTLSSTGYLKYKYNTISPSVQLAIKNPFGGLVPYLAIFGDYVHNPDPSDQENGYLAGIKFGAKKVNNFGDWQMKYMYRHLEKDAWLDTFPDSDAYSGGTDVKGHEVALTYGLGKNTSLGLDYYQMEKIKGSGRRHILQVDWMIKF